ncbi:MAG: tetratricopeptide repeat protein, partial [Candidatus Paracaedibacter sp.]
TLFRKIILTCNFSIHEGYTYLNDRAMEELYNKAIHDNDSKARKQFLERQYSQKPFGKAYPFVDPNKFYNLDTVEWSQCRIDDLVYISRIFGFDRLPAAYFTRVMALEQTGNKYVVSLLANMYVFGKGVGQDLKRALDLFHLAANLGVGQDQNGLGSMYYKGIGVGRDFKKAFDFFQLAANQGFVPAKYNLGAMYYNGLGVGQDFKKAFDLYKLAANQGFAPAQDELKYIEQMRANHLPNLQVPRAENNAAHTNQVWSKNDPRSFQPQLNLPSNFVIRSPMAQPTLGNCSPIQQKEQLQQPALQEELQQLVKKNQQQLQQDRQYIQGMQKAIQQQQQQALLFMEKQQQLYGKTNEVTSTNPCLPTAQQSFNTSSTKVSFDFTSDDEKQSSSVSNSTSPFVSISQEELSRLIRLEVQKALNMTQNNWIEPYNKLLRQNAEMAERLKNAEERIKFLEGPEKNNHS